MKTNEFRTINCRLCDNFKPAKINLCYREGLPQPTDANNCCDRFNGAGMLPADYAERECAQAA